MASGKKNSSQFTAVKSVVPNSPASKTKIAVGDILRRINGSRIEDVLDYKFLTYDRDLIIELANPDGRIKLIKLQKQEGADLGLEFETFLMDRQRSCANKCIFCFIDQLPKDMRKTLYYKDDDVRLSFFQGNYVALTNLTKRDIERIIRLRISPINISVHTMDQNLRAFMLGINDGAAGIDSLIALASAGTILNCQIVCCPGINDGEELSRTIKSLIKLGKSINSVSVVPVGLTKHRQGLAPIQPFSRKQAYRTVRMVESYGKICKKKRGSTMFYCADEMYIKAGLPLPPHSFYEGYPQLENGVGMMRLLITEFKTALKTLDKTDRNAQSGIKEARKPFTIATGEAAGKYLTNLLKIAQEKNATMGGKVLAIRNDYFGSGITVSGLVTGRDLISQLRGIELGSRLLIPQNMLRSGEDIFLDDTTVSDVSEALAVPIRIVKQDGADLLSAIMGE